MMNDPWNSSAVENVLCEHPLFGTTGGFTGGFLADVTNAVSNSDNRSGANGKRGFGVSSAMTGGAAVTASAGGNASGGGFVFDAKKPQSGSAALGGALFPPPPPQQQQQQQPSVPASITESPGRSTTPIDVATAILDDDGATPKQQKEGFYHTQHPVAVHVRHTNLQQQQQPQQQRPKKDVDDLVQQLNGRRPPPLSQRGGIAVLDASKLQQQQQRVTPTLPTTSSPTSPFDAVASGAALPSPAFSVSTGIYPHQHHGIGGSARSSQAASQVSSPTWTTAAIQPQQQQQQPVVFARPQFHQHQQPQPTSPLGSSAASDSMSSGDSSSSKNTPTKMLDVAEGLHDEIRQVHQHLHHADRHPRLLCVVLEFKMENKMRFRCPPEIPIQTGQYVVVRFDSGGEDCGLVEAVYDSPSAMKRAAVRGVPHHDFGVVVRVATDDDCAIINDVLPAKEEEALAKAHQLVHFLHLPFTVVDAECQFDQKLMKVYYTLNPQSYTSNMPNVSRMHRELTFLLKMKVVIEQIKAPKWKR